MPPLDDDEECVAAEFGWHAVIAARENAALREMIRKAYVALERANGFGALEARQELSKGLDPRVR